MITGNETVDEPAVLGPAEISGLLTSLEDVQIREHLSKLIDAGEVAIKEPVDGGDPIYVVAAVRAEQEGVLASTSTSLVTPIIDIMTIYALRFHDVRR